LLRRCRDRLVKLERSSSDLEKVNLALQKIAVKATEELAEFFRQFKLPGVLNKRSVELLDLCSPTEQIQEATEFGQDAFEIKDDFLCLTSSEGEGFVLYSKSSKRAFDASADELDSLEAGDKEPEWNSFFELIE